MKLKKKQAVGEGEVFSMPHVLKQLDIMVSTLNQVKKVNLAAATFPKDDFQMSEHDPHHVLAYNRALADMWKTYYGKMPPEDASIFYDDFPVVECGETLPAFKALEGVRTNTVLQVTKKQVSIPSIFELEFSSTSSIFSNSN
jgi:hypothetical protein